MKFRLVRSSSSLSNPRPKGFVAKKEDFVRFDERTTNSEEKFDATVGQFANEGPWRSKGFGHTVKNNRIRRYFNDKAFFVEIKDLDDLIKFINKNGQIVLGESYNAEGVMEIEIYDDWRE